jgi:peptidoglycan/LPS O-acetylase OafA/YrhL
MPTKTRLAFLDGLRGLAIVFVILLHLSSPGMSCHPAIARVMWLFWYAPSGARLFFVLSGYLLTQTMIRESRAGRKFDFGSYLFARWWRIGPPYYVALAISLSFPAVNLLIGRPDYLMGEMNVHQVAAHVLFLHTLWPSTFFGIDFPLWALSLSFQFYLVFPLLFLLAERVGYRLMIVFVFVASLAFRHALRVYWPDHRHLGTGLFLGLWTQFALGMAIAYWSHEPARGRSRLVSVPSLTLIAAVLVGVIAASGPFGTVRGADLLYGVGYASLLAAVLLSAESGGILSRIFETALLVRLGRLSYSIFLTHCVIIEREFRAYRHLITRTTLATDAAMVLIALGSVYAGGWAFYHVVERHFVRSTGGPSERQPTKTPDPCFVDHSVRTPGGHSTDQEGSGQWAAGRAEGP